jgi:hypothetical protein
MNDGDDDVDDVRALMVRFHAGLAVLHSCFFPQNGPACHGLKVFHGPLTCHDHLLEYYISRFGKELESEKCYRVHCCRDIGPGSNEKYCFDSKRKCRRIVSRSSGHGNCVGGRKRVSC